MTVRLRHAPWLAGAAVLFAASTASAGGPPIGAGPLRVVSPAQDSLARGTSVRLAVHVRARTRIVRASVGGRRVKLRRRPGGLWVARVRRSALSAGLSRFSVAARTRRGRTVRHGARFVVADRRRPGLLRARVGQGRAGGPMPVVVRVSSDRVKLRARLNGRPVHHLFPYHGRRLRGSLSASDGLRHGHNVLRLVAFLPDGSYATVTRRHLRRRVAPLAGAGTDQPAPVGRQLRLNGRGSRATRRGRELVYRWRIVERPRGSHARLRRARAPRPLLRPDRRGVYRLRLTVTERRQPGTAVAAAAVDASDTVTLAAAADAPPIGVPFDTYDDSDPSPAIVVGGERFTKFPVGGGYQVVVLHRGGAQGGTLGVQSATPVPFGSESQLGGLVGSDPTDLVLITATAGGQGVDVTSLNAAITAMGGTVVTDISHGFSIVGIPGQRQGQAYQYVQPGPTPFGVSPFAGIEGYLARDTTNGTAATSAYVPTPSEYVPFTPGAGVADTVVGCNEDRSGYCRRIAMPPPADAPGFVGFVLITLDARSLEQKTVVAYTNLAALAEELNILSQDPSRIVILKSVGGPGPTSVDWFTLSRGVHALGGNPQIFNMLNPGNQASGGNDYVLVAGAGIEASELWGSGSSAQPLNMSGILTRDKGWRFTPSIAGQVGGIDLSLMEIAYQPPKPFPLSGGAYDAAEADIAQQIICPVSLQTQGTCTAPPDIRSQYWRQDLEWSDFGDRLDDAEPQSGAYSPSQFRLLKKQLDNEFTAVATIKDNIENLYAPLQESSQLADLQSIADEIKQSLEPPAADDTASEVLEVLSGVATAVSAAAVVVVAPEAAPAVAAMAGVLAGSAGIGAVFATDDGGNQVLADAVQSTSDTLTGDIERQLGAAGIGLERVRELLVSDYGKLLAASDLATAINQKITPDDAVIASENMLALTVRRQAYRSLLPVGRRLVGPGLVQGPFECVTGFTASGSGVEGHTVRMGLSLPPPEGIYEQVFSAPTFDGDLNAGEDPDDWWIDVFPQLAGERSSLLGERTCDGS